MKEFLGSNCKTTKNQNKLFLASGSPRRKQLLKQVGVKFTVQPSRYCEGKPGVDPQEFVQAAAREKAEEVIKRIDCLGWVLAADTLVVKGDRIFGKPKSRQAAKSMLEILAGDTHSVITGVALIQAPQGKALVWKEKTCVRMRKISGEELERYLKSDEWKDKAGAYGIQGQAGAFVTRISGCYHNVVGLPLGRLCYYFSKYGIGI